MNTTTLKQFVILIFTLVGLGAQSTTPTASDATTKAVSAARSFLASLNETQRSKAANDYNSPKKAGWHNLPTTMVPRGGVTFSDLDETQRKLAMAVVQSVLSPYGYRKMLDIIEADDYFGKNMGAGFPTGPNSCLLAIYGTPSLTEPWMIQLNAHHLGLQCDDCRQEQRDGANADWRLPEHLSEERRHVSCSWHRKQSGEQAHAVAEPAATVAGNDYFGNGRLHSGSRARRPGRPAGRAQGFGHDSRSEEHAD